MKKVILVFAVLLLVPFFYVFSQDIDDDRPYLTDEDIRALEAMLSDDEMIRQVMPSQDKNEDNIEIESTSTRYYIVILERRFCVPNADVSGLKTNNLIYKYLHGANDYLLLIYTDTVDEKANPVYPQNSRVIFEFMTINIDPIRNIVNSDFIKIFIKQDNVLTALRDVLKEI